MKNAMKRIVFMLVVVCMMFALTGCNEKKKLEKAVEDFNVSIEAGEYDEAEDILDNIKELDSDNEYYRDLKKIYKKATDIESKIALCDKIRAALITSTMDPDVLMSDDYNFEPDELELSEWLDRCGKAYEKSFTNIMDMDVDEIYEEMFIAGEIYVILENDDVRNLTVYVKEKPERRRENGE